MIEKRIKTVQDLLDILGQVDDPRNTPFVMSDDLEFVYDSENQVVVLRDEPQGNLALSLPAPFDVFNLAHVYATNVGSVTINMYDVLDDDMIIVFADPAFIPEQGPFNMILGQLADADGDWQEIIGMIYENSVIGYGLSINAEINEADLYAALEKMLQKDEDGNFIARVMATYNNYFAAVSDLYARSYIPATEENDVQWVGMDQRTADAPLYVSFSKTPITDGEKERVYDSDFEDDFGVCIMWSGDTPIIKYGCRTLSHKEVDEHVTADFATRVKVTDNITAAIRTMVYNFEDFICSGR